MGLEIERKFLVTEFNPELYEIKSTTKIAQGYLSDIPERTVRVRLRDQQGYLTIKGAASGASRTEFEYAIPLEDARQMLEELCVSSLSKTRYEVLYDSFLWELDVFEGLNAGLIVAEIELPSEQTSFQKPPFVGEEVTHDYRYSNSYLAKHQLKD
ncbi:MAG: CYTH domain-containing protein [Cytophagales bacterium]|nr:MAG: CYTH domain-containing protein [Cytophagales bacterium]TAF60734.1 MAG: CYTH domain-containing protein [Cytophagales bacterium]